MMDELMDSCARLAVDDAGGPLVRIAFGVTLFVPEIWRPERRAAVATMVSDHAADAGGKLKNWRHPRTGRWGSRLPLDPTEWLAQMSPVDEWSWEACGAKPEVADPWAITALGVPNWQAHCGFVRASWPLSAITSDPESWVERVAQWADALGAEDGQAGLLLVGPPELDRLAAAEPHIRTLAESHVGLLVDAPIAFTLHGSGRVKTIGWLTFVGNQFSAPEPDLPATVLTGASGRIYRQGAIPELGGGLGAVPPAGARAVAIALKRVRLTVIPGLQMAGPDRFDETAATRWLRRFDEGA